MLTDLLVPGEPALTLCLLKWPVSPTEPAFLPENLKKKDVVEILSHKKAYNACKSRSKQTNMNETTLTEAWPETSNQPDHREKLIKPAVLNLQRIYCRFHPG